MTALQMQAKRPAVQRCERTQRVAAASGGVPAQLRLAQALNDGVSVQRLAAVQRMLDSRTAAQRQDIDEEEELAAQMKPIAQREDIYDEELMTQMKPAAQRQDFDEEELTAQMKPAAQRADGAAAGGGSAGSAGGLPAPLRGGVESLSGMDMGGVRVHRNSEKPQSIGALAYAQGDNIYLGAGQDRHLPHEAWHVVQQRQGRVAATMQFNGTAINDSPALEREADTMGSRAERTGQSAPAESPMQAVRTVSSPAVAQGKIVSPGADVGAVVLQRKITYNTTSGQYETDGTRAKWRAYLKASTANEMGVPTTTNFDTLGMDRAHRIPYMAIETLVADFCNGNATVQELDGLTDSLFDTSTSEYDGMVNDRDDLENAVGGTPSIVRGYANSLLSRLNSATLNVSPGNASENRGIQENADYGYQMTPGGTNVELTPRSNQVYNAWSSYGRDPSIPMTPGGQHIRSSQMSSLQYGGTQVDFDDVKW